MNLSVDEVLAEVRTQFPHQYEIALLTVAGRRKDEVIADLQQRVQAVHRDKAKDATAGGHNPAAGEDTEPLPEKAPAPR